MLAAYSLGAAETFGGDAARGRELMLRAVDLLEGEPTLRDDPRHLVTSILVARWLSDPTIALRVRCRGGWTPPGSAAHSARWRWPTRWPAGASSCWATTPAGTPWRVRRSSSARPPATCPSWRRPTSRSPEEEASRGRHDEASRSIAAAHRLVATAGLADIAEFVHATPRRTARRAGATTQRVIAILEPLARVAGRGASGDLLSVAPELVEAYLAVGRADDAATLAHRYAEANPPPLPPIAAGLVARTRALVEPDLDAAGALFESRARVVRPGRARSRPHPAHARRPAAAGRPAGRGAGTAAGRARRVRGRRPDAVGGPGVR